MLDIADRKGFVRLAVRTGAPVILSACPAADDIYHVVSNPLTEWVYNRYRLAAPVMFGAYGTIVPKPAKLVHYVDAPVLPPDECMADDAEVIDAFHGQLERRLQEMLTDHSR